MTQKPISFFAQVMNKIGNLYVANLFRPKNYFNFKTPQNNLIIPYKLCVEKFLSKNVWSHRSFEFLGRNTKCKTNSDPCRVSLDFKGLPST